ncbi:hypothetical protein GLP21_12545 [Photobacterium carnosum]|uniref:Uncharacterized protein n=1 Tax=Photobacterium carnosum TaxID=2023717 RepID=A0A2N4UWD1_9GAMM|nr:MULTISPECIES: hypothetical protein [Photobacterium]MCD9475896.1 hypothetical protein [Photobacterium phosphoreum]MCD9485944.1 hypothetical protein [Photobacterium iliopiscarium]MCD9507758.1 hypothetical protein [Photobacterium phosphoreum]MCD9538120.1 hypothetical protein [Photobacterium carnosum]MCD9542592.1 hypothetical protein [Photobacterium carnosum]
MKLSLLTIILSSVIFSSSAFSTGIDPLVKNASAKNSELHNSINKTPVEQVFDKNGFINAMKMYKSLHWGVRLPITDLSIIENQDGERLLIDSNARMVIRGNFQLYDLWNKRVVTDKASVQKMWLTPLSIFSVNDDDLAIYHYGKKKDKADLTVLIDPNGKFNAKLFSEMELLADKYAFDILLVPLTGKNSIMDSISLWCNKDQSTSLEYLMEGAKIKSDLTLIPTCNKKPLMMNVALASLLHIKSLPHLVRVDGLNNSGTPSNLEAFMHQDISKIGEVIIK